MALTEKQRRFAEVYAGNATRAARLAGYSGDDNTLGVRGHKLLDHPEVAALIAQRKAAALVDHDDDLADDDEDPNDEEFDPDAPLIPVGVDRPERRRILQRIMRDPTSKGSDVNGANRELRAMDREDAAAAREAGGGDVLQRLRTGIAEALRKKRERERD